MLVYRRACAKLLNARSGLLWFPVRGSVAPGGVATSVMGRLALLRYQRSVLVARLLQFSVSAKVFSLCIFLLLHVLHLSTLHLDGVLDDFVFLNELLYVNLSTIVLLLETMCIRSVVGLLLLLLLLVDVLPRLFLTGPIALV